MKNRSKVPSVHLFGIIALTAVIVFSMAALSLTGCPTDDNGGGGNTHTHSYRTTWSYNATQHWHECEECGDKKDVASHTMNNDTCTVCGYSSNSGGGGTLNGTWVQSGVTLKLNNGSFEVTVDNLPYTKGTYTASNGVFTMQITHIGGGMSFGDESQWNSKAAMIAEYGNNSEIEFMFAEHTGSYSLAGNTLTFSGLPGDLGLGGTYTKSTGGEYWSITWNLNGGVAGTGAYPAQIAKGTVLAKPSPDPTKDGNTFGGWYANTDLTQEYNFANTVTAPLSLYAKWTTGSGGSGNPPTTWTLAADSTFGNSGRESEIYSIAWGGDKFVAAGVSYTSSDYSSTWTKAAYSGNGTNWTAITNFPGEVGCPISQIAYGGGKFLGFGFNSNSDRLRVGAYSSNGTSWTKLTVSQIPFYSSSFHAPVTAITYGGDKFVAGASNQIAYSSDGLTWTTRSSTWQFRSIAYGNNKFIAVGDRGRITYSYNGINWTDVVNPFSSNSGQSINAVTWGGDKFVAGGTGGQMAYSSDGEEWTAVSNSKFGSNNAVYAIAYGGGYFVAVGGSGKVVYSADGVTWTEVPNSIFDIWMGKIAYGGGRFVIVGALGKIAYSNVIQ